MQDNKSTTSSIARAKVADKHCLAEECNGKKITASNWSTHIRTKQHQKNVGWQKCVRQSCEHCQIHQGKI